MEAPTPPSAGSAPPPPARNTTTAAQTAGTAIDAGLVACAQLRSAAAGELSCADLELLHSAVGALHAELALRIAVARQASDAAAAAGAKGAEDAGAGEEASAGAPRQQLAQLMEMLMPAPPADAPSASIASPLPLQDAAAAQATGEGGAAANGGEAPGMMLLTMMMSLAGTGGKVVLEEGAVTPAGDAAVGVGDVLSSRLQPGGAAAPGGRTADVAEVMALPDMAGFTSSDESDEDVN